jgi:hypothetical protein
LWEDLAPKNNVRNIGNKNIFLVISKSDKVIPYFFGKEFANLLARLYPEATSIEENSLGHYLTIAKYYLFGKKVDKSDLSKNKDVSWGNES